MTDESAVAEAPDAAPTPPEPTPHDAVDRALNAVMAEDAEPAKAVETAPDTEQAPEPEKKGPARDEKGKFAKSEGETEGEDATEDEQTDDEAAEGDDAEPEDKSKSEPFADPPSRFSTDAKAAWKDAPAPVRAEIHRAVKELEAGLAKHRADAQAFSEIKDFDTLARQHGTSIRAALENYTSLERTIAQDPLKGLEAVCNYAGLSLRDVAAHVMGQDPDQAASRSDATVRELRQEIAGLKQLVSGVTTTIQEQRSTSTMQEVETFASQHPRFDELSEAIATEIKHGYDLAAAYERADRLNPAAPAPSPPPPPAAVQPAKPDPSAQTRKGSLSVTGAPGPGSDPGSRKPPKSASDAVDRAFGQLGIA